MSENNTSLIKALAMRDFGARADCQIIKAPPSSVSYYVVIPGTDKVDKVDFVIYRSPEHEDLIFGYSSEANTLVIK